MSKNGNVERVHDAISQGVTERDAIATWLGIDKQATDNALKRLVDGKRIRKDGKGWALIVPTLTGVW